MDIKGKPTNVSKEYVRSWASASACVLSHHGYHVDQDTLVVSLRKIVNGNEDVHGLAYRYENKIELKKSLNSAEMSIAILHEMIHRATSPDGFGENTDEKCTSTLNSRLHGDVGAIAQILIDGTYRRAAHFAHTKISYRTDDDHYDTAEDSCEGCKDKYHV